MASHNAWKAEFKQSMGILVIITLAILVISTWVFAGVFSPRATPPASQLNEAVPAAAPSSISGLLLIISVAFGAMAIGFFVNHRIPPDITSSLIASLETLGWVVTASHPGRGSCIARKGDWEMSVAIHLYNFALQQWGPASLSLSCLDLSHGEEICTRFQDAGFLVHREVPLCIVSCQTNVPQLPWQILRITSLLGVRNDTTAFS